MSQWSPCAVTIIITRSAASGLAVGWHFACNQVDYGLPNLVRKRAVTRRQLRRAIITVIVIYFTAGVTGLVLRATTTSYYDTFRDIIPFIFAIPAAYLGYCFQRRSSYLESLRSLWSKLVRAVQEAIRYTYDPTPTQEEYADVLTALAIVIDEVRGVYKNVGERPGHIGLFPFEPIKEIHSAMRTLGYGELGAEERELARKRLIGHWQSIRANFLDEFDRAEPSKVVSPYLETASDARKDARAARKNH